MPEIFFILGGSLFTILGLAHALYTFQDTMHPRRLVPEDRTVIEAMSSTGVRLSRGGTTMWRAWVGFNYSHSLGAVVFGCCCVFLGLALKALTLPKTALMLPVVIGALYFGLALKYWFRAPAIGIALATLCLCVAWLSY